MRTLTSDNEGIRNLGLNKISNPLTYFTYFIGQILLIRHPTINGNG